MMRSHLTRTIATAACCVGLTLVAWVALVMLLDHRFRGFDQLVWSLTLWLSALLSTGAVAYSRYSKRPALACSIAFGLFGVAYMACEGPVFGAVAEGGDPSMTVFVVCNLVSLPLGAFSAAEVGAWLGRRHRTKNANEQPVVDGVPGTPA